MGRVGVPATLAAGGAFLAMTPLLLPPSCSCPFPPPAPALFSPPAHGAASCLVEVPWPSLFASQVLVRASPFPRLEFLLLWLGGFYELVVHLVGNVRLLLKSGLLPEFYPPSIGRMYRGKGP